MTAVFRDKQGSFVVNGVEMIQYDKTENKWVVFFEDDGKEEYTETELERIMKD